MKKNILFLGALLFVLGSVFAQDNTNNNPWNQNRDIDFSNEDVVTDFTFEVPTYKVEDYDFSSVTQTIYLTLNKDTATVSQTKSKGTTVTSDKTMLYDDTISVSSKDGLIKLDLSSSKQASIVYVSGKLTTGGLKIQTNKKVPVQLVLNNCDITSSIYPCIEITKGATVYVQLNGKNTLTDGRQYGTGYGEEYSTDANDTYKDDDGNKVACTLVKSAVRNGSDAKGALYNKGSLVFDGKGSLTVNQGYKNCIASKGYITVNGGTFNLTSNSKSGFSALYGFVQNNGEINFTGNGAMNASTQANDESYCVKKAHGVAVDGIISSKSNGWIIINGGKFTSVSNYGKGLNAKWDPDEDTDTDGTTGTVDASVYITGGTVSIKTTGLNWTGDDTMGKSYYYYDADGVECYENIKCAAEGIEGNTLIAITGGTLEIEADDDGLNMSYEGGNIAITGGNTYIYSTAGDGVDSNGNIYISGGNLVTVATLGMEDGLDCGDMKYRTVITGGLVASLSGGSMGINEIMGVNQGVINLGSSYFGKQGETVAVKDKDGNVVYAFTLPYSDTNLTISSPLISTDSSYEIYSGVKVSGGSSFHGLYTKLPKVSKGTSTGTIEFTDSNVCNLGITMGFGGPGKGFGPPPDWNGEMPEGFTPPDFNGEPPEGFGNPPADWNGQRPDKNKKQQTNSTSSSGN